MRFITSLLALVALIAALVSAAPACATDPECRQLVRQRRRTLRLRPRSSTTPPTCKANGASCQATTTGTGPNMTTDVKGGCCNVCSVGQSPGGPMNLNGTCKTCVDDDSLCSTKDDCCSKKCMGGKCKK